MSNEVIVSNNNKEVLRLHNSFINAIFSLSADAKKLLLAVWLHSDGINNVVKVYQKDIEEKVGIDIMHLNIEHREKIVEELMKTIITIRDIKNPNNFKKFALLRDTEYKDGLLTADLSPNLLPYIKEAQEKLFTRFKIQNIKPMTSSHAIRIYLLLKQYDDTGWREMSLDDFKKIMELEYKYPRIYDLKKYVLEVAKRQINENTDIEIDYELIKQGRKYTKIKFKIKSKEKEKKKSIQTDNRIPNKKDTFNTFRQDILSKVSENDVILLDDKTFEIKDNLLYLNDKLLSKEEALEQWKELYNNQDKIKIESKDKLKQNNLKVLEQKVNTLYKGKKTFIIVNGDYVNVIVAKIEIIELDNIKIIFKGENNKFYELHYSNIESLKNL